MTDLMTEAWKAIERGMRRNIIRKVKRATVIQTLKRHATWIEKLDRATWDKDLDRVHDVVIWCFDYLDYSPTTDVAAWRTRFPHRKRLLDLDTCAKYADGRKAICELITLTISELEAMPDTEIEVSLLPGVRSTARTEAQLAGLAKARDAKAAQTIKTKAAKTRRLAAATEGGYGNTVPL